MIPTVHKRGRNVRGLLAYLYGPGRHEEHRNPHIIAAWTGPQQIPWLEPTCGPTGRHDIGRLARLLNQPVNAAANPPELTVWHTSVRNHASDRPLTDQQWAHIAREIMNAVGLAPHGDPNAVRWAAIRHAEDHIHVVATLVRQDGKTAWGWNEKYKAQAAARRLERELGLHQVGPADHTAHRYPGAAEQNKTRRLGHRDVPRDRLRREVRTAAAASAGEAEFFDRLRNARILVRLRHSTIDGGDITGYSVGLPSHRTSTGDTIWYGGGRLSPDLTLPRLRHRWGRPTAGPEPRVGRGAAVLGSARDAIQSAGKHMTNVADASPDRAATVAVQCSDVLVTLARTIERGRVGPLTMLCDQFDHAARTDGRHRPAHSVAGGDLRSSARLIATLNHIDTTRDARLLLDLLQAMATFADTLANLRHAQRRLHQARSALSAAAALRAAATKLASQQPHQLPLPLTIDHPIATGARPPTIRAVRR
ncbi:relaxase/mobilization nuclease domain-containing protein [Virgisporangium aurantiacum]|uniref:Mobilization protein n=1 Tax=Virgisporangium aurantiacum TaxID=175570 RepID=A0A8J3Z7A3_9ACTN|nr:relaxase [Virgisporangium aurantiacum]GIJ56198.1 mobilization protein [Virgisporangium aurantiacum]